MISSSANLFGLGQPRTPDLRCIVTQSQRPRALWCYLVELQVCGEAWAELCFE
jgi:hypothetical protein